MIRSICLIAFALMFFSCAKETPTAQEIIDKTISAAGGEKYSNFELEFDFRDKHYKAIRDGGTFQYERHFKDSVNQIRDVLTNNGFQRFINNELANIPDSMAVKYTSSVNSVHYFALLPSQLNDAAVNKTYLGKVTIKDKVYHKVKVTFDQEGGGEDYEDVFVYWITADTFKADFIAYSYIESDGVGLRFREAYNERMVNGLRFVDYNNYKPEDSIQDVTALDKLFESNALKLLSKIETENITVK